MDKTNFFDSAAFGCLVWAVFGAAFYGVSRLLLPLVEYVPTSTSAREILLLLWSLYFVISGWSIFLCCVVGDTKARSALLWLFYGWFGTVGASAILLASYGLVGRFLPKDWLFVFGMGVLLGYLHLIFLPAFHWLLEKHSSKR